MYREGLGWGCRKDSYGQVRPYPFCVQGECWKERWKAGQEHIKARDERRQRAAELQARREARAADPNRPWDLDDLLDDL